MAEYSPKLLFVKKPDYPVGNAYPSVPHAAAEGKGVRNGDLGDTDTRNRDIRFIRKL